ncbi:MAG: hypothetical protein QM808_07185 [Steroidobacteraceae bacterium]
MKREYLLHGILFVTAYLGFVAYYKPSAPVQSASANVNSAVPEAKSMLASAAMQEKVQVASKPQAAAGETAKQVPVVAATESAIPADMQQSIGNLGQQVMTEEGSAKRRSAIAKLGNQPLTPETTQALHWALTYDSVVANRVQAVNALRRQAQSNGDADGSIRQLLSSAMQDSEPRVADAARDIYSSLQNSP